MKSTPFTLVVTMWFKVFFPEPPTPMTFILANASTSGLICGILLVIN
jgi:hypothetical protein